MTESLVPDKLTPCPPGELYACLKAAWVQTCQDSDPGRASLLVLLAHWALETGFGHYCHNFNIGNKKHVPGDGHDFSQFRCNEVIGGQIVWFDPPNPGCSFVAFSSLAAGTLDYFIGMRGRFRVAWPFVLSGDVAGFCHALKVANYYTADEGLYTAGVVRCYHQLDGVIPPDPTEAITLEEFPPDPHVDPEGTNS